MKRILQTRQVSEQQAMSHATPRNHILASELAGLLESRKSSKSLEEIRQMASRYNLDVEVLERLAKTINTPTVIPGSRRKVVGENGEERDIMLVSDTKAETFVRTLNDISYS